MSTLLLRLSGPLQSWGSDSKYDERRTDRMPTKSGVIGMLAAALGRGRDESVEDLNDLRFGVRIDAGGKVIDDFQITEMGQKLNANISRRKYLTDATFLVGLESQDHTFLTALDEALRNPVYPLFLGRRSCPPTMPLTLGLRECTLYRALFDEEWQVPEWRRRTLDRTLRIIIDAESETNAMKRDVPVSFSPFDREYRSRYLEEMKPRVISAEEEEHDPMKELR